MKAREFWLLPKYEEIWTTKPESEDYIHVVEHSAYDQAVEALKAINSVNLDETIHGTLKVVGDIANKTLKNLGEEVE